MRYPWLEEAVARALADSFSKPPFQQLKKKASRHSPTGFPLLHRPNPSKVSSFVRQFVQNLQRTTDPPENERLSYLEIGIAPKTWERAHWLDGERLDRDLTGVLEYAWVDESLDSPRNLVSEAVVRRNASFVALVDSDRRFVGLVDRYALLTQTSAARNSARGGDRDAS